MQNPMPYFRIAEVPTLDSVTLTFGNQRLVIPTPPMQRIDNDFNSALLAAVIGLAIKAGIEPETIAPTSTGASRP